MGQPSLLIVVPTLDSYLLLPRLIHSLKLQTFSDWRLVFIDGPSDAKHRTWLKDCCSADTRFGWVEQLPDSPGIFGAMNQGFSLAEPDEWILFWGSDDWAPHPYVLENLFSLITSPDCIYDLVISTGRYVNLTTMIPGRSTRFHPQGVLDSCSYRRSLFLGSTPPHQATLFCPSKFRKRSHYSPSFRLAADLDYFLQLSSHPDLSVMCTDLELVHISDGGISARQSRSRFQEVRRAYFNIYGFLWIFPFSLRYFRRFISLFVSIL